MDDHNLCKVQVNKHCELWNYTPQHVTNKKPILFCNVKSTLSLQLGKKFSVGIARQPKSPDFRNLVLSLLLFLGLTV